MSSAFESFGFKADSSLSRSHRFAQFWQRTFFPFWLFSSWMASHFRQRRFIYLYSIVGLNPLLALRPRFGRSDLSMDVIATCWWIPPSRTCGRKSWIRHLCSLDSKRVFKRMNISVLNNLFLIDLQCSSCSPTSTLTMYSFLARALICDSSIRFWSTL